MKVFYKNRQHKDWQVFAEDMKGTVPAVLKWLYEHHGADMYLIRADVYQLKGAGYERQRTLN